MDLKEKIKAADDIKKKIVKMPEWDNIEIEVRSMSGYHRAMMFDTCINEKGNFSRAKSHPFFVFACSFDPQTGTRIFDETDLDWIGEKNAGALEKIVLPAMKLSGLAGIEEIEKN